VKYHVLQYKVTEARCEYMSHNTAKIQLAHMLKSWHNFKQRKCKINYKYCMLIIKGQLFKYKLKLQYF
jgi:hypothetical protein